MNQKITKPIGIALPMLAILWIFTVTAQAAAKRYVITDFGAVTNSQVVNTKAIQSAIDLCADSGGGMVVVPKGTYIAARCFSSRASTCWWKRMGCSRARPIRMIIRRSTPAGKAWSVDGQARSSTSTT